MIDKIVFLDIDTGMIIKILNSISEAGRETNNRKQSIVDVCKGRRANAGGYI